MSEGIYLEQDGQLVDMRAAPYESEDLLQQLLERHAMLLAGDQLTPDAEPRRFVLVKREAGIPDSETSGDRWSVDHVFLDQDGVVTFVEAKRSSNPQIRREIVGQLLEYAANAVVYWPSGKVRTQFEATHGSIDGGYFEQLRYLLGLGDASPEDAEPDIEAFWLLVTSNLAARRVRLLFVADALPAELRRIIEFLNEQMSPADVLGIEVRNYEGPGGYRALVPNVIGLTETAQEAKRTAGTSSPPIEELWPIASPQVQEVRTHLDTWATKVGWAQWDAGKSRRYSPVQGPNAVVSLYPADMYRSIYVLLDPVKDDGTIGTLQKVLGETIGRTIKTTNPGVSCSVLLKHWPVLEAKFLDPLAAAMPSQAPPAVLP